MKLYTRSLATGEKTELVHLSFYGKPLTVRIGTSDISVFHHVFLEEEYNLDFLNLKPKLILDVGANVGYTSIFFAQTYPEAHIIAVEPEESNFQTLTGNTKPYPNIVPVRAAIWHKKGRLQITNPNAEKWAFQLSETGEETPSVTVDALTIGDLLAMSGENTIGILKLDIEGAEIELCSSNYEGWLEKTRVLIIELHDRFRTGCSEALNSAVSSYNFQRTERGEHTILFKTAT